MVCLCERMLACYLSYVHTCLLVYVQVKVTGHCLAHTDALTDTQSYSQDLGSLDVTCQPESNCVALLDHFML